MRQFDFAVFCGVPREITGEVDVFIKKVGFHLGQVINHPDEIPVGVNSVQLADLDQRGHRRPGVTSFFAANEERAFAQKNDRFELSFDRARVEVDAPVFEE